MTAGTVQAPPLQKFYLTFGVQYRHTPHPYWKGADPDGWVLIEAPGYAEARALAVRHFGQNWSMLYDTQNFDEAENQYRYYPKGAIAVIIDDGTGVVYGTPDGVPAPSVHITPRDPEYYGRDRYEIVATLVKGHLLKRPNPDHDEAMFHLGCAEEGHGLFLEVCKQWQVQAHELDWNQPAHCKVCETSIT